MCDTCKEVENIPMDQALALVGRELVTRPSEQDHLSDLLDKLLGTEDRTSEDPELALEWELAHRRRED